MLLDLKGEMVNKFYKDLSIITLASSSKSPYKSYFKRKAIRWGVLHSKLMKSLTATIVSCLFCKSLGSKYFHVISSLLQ